MRSCASACYELARTLSTQGFTVAVRPTSDRPTSLLGVTCLHCGTRYDLAATRPKTGTQLVEALDLLAGAVA